jgi:hypothetical protein
MSFAKWKCNLSQRGGSTIVQKVGKERFIKNTLDQTTFPKIVKVKQEFDEEHIVDVPGYLCERLQSLNGFQDIRPGQRVAVAAGSRAISSIDIVIRTVIEMVKERGAQPFIVPAMGSHGGATAEGQQKVLETLGITEEKMGCPILSSMEVVQIGKLFDERPVYLDKNADAADGIILINRIKAHTSFRGKYESGLMKMMAVGLGKQLGAQTYHQTGFGLMGRIVEEVGYTVLNKKNIFFGLGIIENGNGKIAQIHCLNSDEIAPKEKELLKKTNKLLPRLFCRELDVLSIQKIGKDISGTGMDSNIIGRFNNDDIHSEDIYVKRIAVLDLSDKSKGNANGVGMADFISKRLYKKISLEQTYPNALTSTATVTVKIPMILPNDKMTIAAAIKTSMLAYQSKVRLALIESTKNMTDLYISENMIDEAREKGVKIISKPFPIPFLKNGRLHLKY